jgi:hypothetical protein
MILELRNHVHISPHTDISVNFLLHLVENVSIVLAR